jgi:hypothetical protein
LYKTILRTGTTAYSTQCLLPYKNGIAIQDNYSKLITGRSRINRLKTLPEPTGSLIKNPRRKYDGDPDCTDLVTDQSAVNGINATLRARLIAVVSSR